MIIDTFVAIMLALSIAFVSQSVPKHTAPEPTVLLDTLLVAPDSASVDSLYSIAN